MGVLSEKHAPTSDKNASPGSSRRTFRNASTLAAAANWLPTPNGPMALTLRVYGPSDAMRRGDAPLPRLLSADAQADGTRR
jgi:hypothetical protein